MNHNVTQGIRFPVARVRRRVAAIVAECRSAQTQLTSLRNPRSVSDPGGASGRLRAKSPIRISSPLLHEPAVRQPGQRPAAAQCRLRYQRVRAVAAAVIYALGTLARPTHQYGRRHGERNQFTRHCVTGRAAPRRASAAREPAASLASAYAPSSAGSIWSFRHERNEHDRHHRRSLRRRARLAGLPAAPRPAPPSGIPATRCLTCPATPRSGPWAARRGQRL